MRPGRQGSAGVAGHDAVTRPIGPLEEREPGTDDADDSPAVDLIDLAREEQEIALAEQLRPSFAGT
jgi:hypothetical protein